MTKPPPRILLDAGTGVEFGNPGPGRLGPLAERGPDRPGRLGANQCAVVVPLRDVAELVVLLETAAREVTV